MPGITPIAATRISDQLIRSRLLTQMQFDQKSLFDIQSQISTGRRILLPSQDAPAAARAISLQRLIERKTQVTVNVSTNQSFLSSTDSALSTVSGLLSQIRGSALSVVGTTSDSTQREAVAQEVDRAIQQLLNTGNQTFRGRYLFAGAKITEAPFANVDGLVQYTGNETSLKSYSDIETLFESSINGNAVFGAISPEVRGTADLNPSLTANTRLSDLRGGLGISRGSIVISDGSNSRTIDISRADTIGDVARMIEGQPPAGRSVRVTVTPTGLKLELDQAGGGALSVREVGGGTTAKQLGILQESGTTSLVVNGQDVDPRLQKTTLLSNILGAKALSRIQSTGANNDLIINATAAGAASNGVTFQLVDDDALTAAPGLTAGNEVAELDTFARAANGSLSFTGANNDLILTASTAGTQYNNVTFQIATQVGNAGLTNGAKAAYDSNTKTLTLTLDNTNNAITTADIQAAISTGTPFTASLDASADLGNTGAGTVDGATVLAGAAGSTSNSGGAANTLYVRIEKDVSSTLQVANAINTQLTSFSATADSFDATNSVLNGTTAINVNATGTTYGGSGIVFDQDSGVRINNAGKTFDISLSTAKTVEDLLNIFNGSGAGVVASINSNGTGINVRSNLSGSDFSIGEIGGTTATELGIRSFTENTALNSLNGGLGVHTADGTDFTIVRNDGTELNIDISSAVTIGDVLNLINNNPTNVGSRATGQVVANGPNNDFTVTATENGPSLNGVTVQLVDDALLQAAPGLTQGNETAQYLTVPRAAQAKLTFNGSNNDLVLQATTAGIDFNNVTVAITGNATGAPTASYDPNTKTLSIDIESDGSTTANDIVAALSSVSEFSASIDVSAETLNDGTGTIASFDNPTFSSTGNSGANAKTLYVRIANGVSTAENVVAAINTEGTFSGAISYQDAQSAALAGKGALDVSATGITDGGSGQPGDNAPSRVVARLAQYGNGIELVDDDPSGVDANGQPKTLKVFTSNQSQAAVDLGLVPAGSTVSNAVTPAEKAVGIADLTNPNSDITFSATYGGTSLNNAQVRFVNQVATGNQAFASYDAVSNTLTIDVDFGATTAQTVIDVVNGGTGGRFAAKLNTDQGPNTGLGTINPADAGTVATLTGGTPEILTGRNVNPQEVQGVFNTLLRLKAALDNGDNVQIERTLGMLDSDVLRVNFARAEVGARQQGLDVLQIRLEDESTELKSSLSTEIDTDFTEAISNLTARQFAYEASLRTTGTIMQLSLLNYL